MYAMITLEVLDAVIFSLYFFFRWLVASSISKRDGAETRIFRACCGAPLTSPPRYVLARVHTLASRLRHSRDGFAMVKHLLLYFSPPHLYTHVFLLSSVIKKELESGDQRAHAAPCTDQFADKVEDPEAGLQQT